MRVAWIVVAAVAALVLLSVLSELPSLHRYQKISRM